MRSICLFLFCAAGLAAQNITGTLHDRTGAVISGARVLLMNEDYVKLAEAKSGEQGEFSFGNLKPALYFVQAKKPVFMLCQQHVMLEPGTNAHVYLVATIARGLDVSTISVERTPGVAPQAPKYAAFRAGGRTEPFKFLKRVHPRFPEAARQRGAWGRVAFYGTIKADGALVDIVTLDSPDPELEKAGLEAFSQWRFEPMKLDGVPVETGTIVVFNFEYR